MYIALTCRLDLKLGFTVCFQVLNVDATSAKHLKTYIAAAKRTQKTGLNFVALGASLPRIAVFAVAGFVANCNLSSHHRFIVTLAEKRNNVDIVNYSCFKSKRITRSVLAA